MAGSEQRHELVVFGYDESGLIMRNLKPETELLLWVAGLFAVLLIVGYIAGALTS